MVVDRGGNADLLDRGAAVVDGEPTVMGVAQLVEICVDGVVVGPNEESSFEQASHLGRGHLSEEHLHRGALIGVVAGADRGGVFHLLGAGHLFDDTRTRARSRP